MLYQKELTIVGARTDADAQICEWAGFTPIPNGLVPQGDGLIYRYCTPDGRLLPREHLEYVHYYGWTAYQRHYRSPVCPLVAVTALHSCEHPCKRRKCPAWQPKATVPAWQKKYKADRHKNRKTKKSNRHYYILCAPGERCTGKLGVAATQAQCATYEQAGYVKEARSICRAHARYAQDRFVCTIGGPDKQVSTREFLDVVYYKASASTIPPVPRVPGDNNSNVKG